MMIEIGTATGTAIFRQRGTPANYLTDKVTSPEPQLGSRKDLD